MEQARKPPRKNVRHEVIAQAGYNVHIVGGRRPTLRDIYLGLLRMRLTLLVLLVVSLWLALNVVFALVYLATGGVANATPGSFSDAFFFSVQTLATIGYGALSPESTAANVVVVVESLLGLMVTALVTGLVFVRFSQIRARMMFVRRIALSPMNGVPTLHIRVGNERRSAIVDACFRLTLSRTTRTAEGVTFYRSDDLALVRDRAPALSRSWTVLHTVDATSPLHGTSPASLQAGDVELTLSVTGTDETTMQPMHARHTWGFRDVAFGARLADVVTEHPNGDMTLDLTAFHDLVATEPTETFPYP